MLDDLSLYLFLDEEVVETQLLRYCGAWLQKCSGKDHTAFNLQTHLTCLYLVSVHQTAPPLSRDSSHLIAAYYSIDPMRMKG